RANSSSRIYAHVTPAKSAEPRTAACHGQLQVPRSACRLTYPLQPCRTTANAALRGQIEEQPVLGLPDEDATCLQPTRRARDSMCVVHRRPAAAEFDGDAGTHPAKRVDAVAKRGALAREQITRALNRSQAASARSSSEPR